MRGAVGREEGVLGSWNPAGRCLAAGLCGLLSLLAGCGKAVEPMPTPPPTPDDVTRYIMATDEFTSYGAIVYINDMSADDVSRSWSAMQAIEPPKELEPWHDLALEAYGGICRGKLLLPGADGELRAEAYFMIEWGIGRLLEYREQLDKLRF